MCVDTKKNVTKMLIATLSQNNIKKKEKIFFLLHHSALADKMNKNRTL